MQTATNKPAANTTPRKDTRVRNPWYKGFGTKELKEFIRWAEYKVIIEGKRGGDEERSLDAACVELSFREEC